MRTILLTSCLVLLSACTVFRSQSIDLSAPPSHLSGEKGDLTYFLPTGRLKLAVDFYSDGSLELASSVELIPDNSRAYTLQYRRSGLSSDDIAITLTDSGFLASVTATTTDETPQIIKDLTTTAINIVKFLATAAGADERQKALHAEFAVDPLNCRDVHDVNTLLLWIGVRMDVIEDVRGASVTARCSQPRDAAATGASYAPPLPTPTPTGTPGKWMDGLIYRPLLAYRLAFTSGLSPQRYRNMNPPENRPPLGVQTRLVLLPNDAPTMRLQIDRAAFVKNSAGVTFKNGMPTSLTYDKPSEVAGFVKIPLDISTQLVSLPKDLLTIRYDNVTTRLDREKALLDKQALILKAQKDLIDAQNALIEAKKGAPTPGGNQGTSTPTPAPTPPEAGANGENLPGSQ